MADVSPSACRVTAPTKTHLNSKLAQGVFKLKSINLKSFRTINISWDIKPGRVCYM